MLAPVAARAYTLSYGPPFSSTDYSAYPNNTCTTGLLVGGTWKGCTSFSTSSGAASQYLTGGATCGDTSCGGTPDIYVYFVPTITSDVLCCQHGHVYFEMEYEYDGALSGSNSGSQVTLEYGWQQCDSSDFNCTNYNTPWVIWSTTSTLSESGTTAWDLYVSSPVSGDYYGFGGGAQPALYIDPGPDGTGGATVDFYNSPYYMTATDFEADT